MAPAWSSADLGRNVGYGKPSRYDDMGYQGRVAKTALRDVRRASLENTSFAKRDLISHRKLRASRALARRTRANDISLLETPKQNEYSLIKNI